jgi:microcystin-dependent protein
MSSLFAPFSRRRLLGSLLRILAAGCSLLGASTAFAVANTTGITGSSTAFNTTQPSLALTWMICVSNGLYPSRDGTSTADDAILGEIRLLAYDGSSNTSGWLPCNGQVLSIAQNQALFSVIGTVYGGNGTTTFALPDLRGRVPIGSGQGTGLTSRLIGETGGAESTTLTTQNLPAHAHTYTGATIGVAGGSMPFSSMQPYLALNFCVEAGGTFDSLGWVRIFAFNFTPSGHIACDGRLLSIQANTALFSKLGTIFGGNGTTTFAVPDLRGRTPIGTGLADSGTAYTLGGSGGAETITLLTTEMPAHVHSYGGGNTTSTGGSQPHDTMQPYLVLRPLIASTGIYQSLSAEPGIGEVRLFATNSPSLTDRGWFDCAGQLVLLSEYQALASLLGTSFGGDGSNTFGLPKISGRALAHFGQGASLTSRVLATTWGTESVTLLTSNLAAHAHVIFAAPTVTTTAQSSVAATSATLGGNVTADGGASVTDRGIVWATATGPTTADNKVAIGTGTGSFSQSVTGLPASTTLYVRAYAINSIGTSYGSEISFTTPAADTTPPTIVSIARLTPSAQTIGDGTTSFTFRVTYSEAVQSVTIAQFSVEAVNGSNITGTVASVSGTGTTRDVTVTISGGAGEFRLKAID